MYVKCYVGDFCDPVDINWTSGLSEQTRSLGRLTTLKLLDFDQPPAGACPTVSVHGPDLQSFVAPSQSLPGPKVDGLSRNGLRPPPLPINETPAFVFTIMEMCEETCSSSLPMYACCLFSNGSLTNGCLQPKPVELAPLWPLPLT